MPEVKIGQVWRRKRGVITRAEILDIRDNHRGDILEICYRLIREDGGKGGSHWVMPQHLFSRYELETNA